MLHIPILRRGEPYQSIETVRTPHYRTREPFVDISQANAGLIRRDLLDQQTAKQALLNFSSKELLEMCARAAAHFMNDDLTLGDATQSPQDYVEQVSATTGLPFVMVRRNMGKISGVMAEMSSVLSGLTRNLDLGILDRGFGDVEGQAMSFYPRTESLGVVLPNNSPGVHSLWVPAIALKTALVLKPGSAEPWTPYRIIQAFIRAGCPREAFSYYPADHSAASEILRRTGRGMVFGDTSSTARWQNDPRVEVHGPGYSKVIIGEDCIDEFEKYLDVIVTSVVDNGGRSCVNASGVWVPRRAAEVSEALAERFARVVPRAADDPEAEIAPFADPNVAARVSRMIDQDLDEPGARDVTASHRAGERLVTWEGSTYLLPTVVHCDSDGHALANREFLFPFASVVEVGQNEVVERIGPSLVVTAITQDPDLIQRLLSSRHVDRLNIGAMPTNRISWDQPHEGNLFEHLYARRSFQRAMAV